MEGAELISQGAEAKVYLLPNYLGEPAIVKERLIKTYRHPDLDARLTKERMTFEVRNMVRAHKAGINTPFVMHTDFNERKIYMQKIDGLKLRDFIFTHFKATTEDSPTAVAGLVQVLKEVGGIIARLHDQQIIHGDLTTSNIMVATDDSCPTKLYRAIYLIDFGLSFVKDSIEEKAVDLYVLGKLNAILIVSQSHHDFIFDFNVNLEKAFISTHPELEVQFQDLLQEYKHLSKAGDKTIKKLNEVRMRGRKKVAFG